MQDKGPIEWRFKDQGKDVYTYVHIDGEFYKLKNAESITFTLATDALPNGQLKLLARNKEELEDEK